MTITGVIAANGGGGGGGQSNNNSATNGSPGSAGDAGRRWRSKTEL